MPTSGNRQVAAPYSFFALHIRILKKLPGTHTRKGVSSIDEARTPCYVLYRMWRRWVQHPSRKRPL